MTENYGDFFKRVMDGRSAHPWQLALGEDSSLKDRLIRIPTGFGKTAGVILAWLYNRIVRNDSRNWPTRLVFCLPMRVLVEQTEKNVNAWLEKSGYKNDVGVHVFMGGDTEDDREWILHPEKPAILIGTQDMLISRALNRGYASRRTMWPVEFGFINNDVLWVLDEVQLMDVGLATATQLAGFRHEDLKKAALKRPVACWWMSATLQDSWLDRATDMASEQKNSILSADARICIPKADRGTGLWNVTKKLNLEYLEKKYALAPQKVKSSGDDDGKSEADAYVDKQINPENALNVAEAILKTHVPGKLTLVIVNTVAKAMALYTAIENPEGKSAKPKKKKGAVESIEAPTPKAEVLLIHGRYRGCDRKRLARQLSSPIPPEGRIVVATQVVEAGVDISASVLFTEVAPWPCLVQRFGRAARYEGDSADVYVFGASEFKRDSDSLPYQSEDCREAVVSLKDINEIYGDVSISSLENYEANLDKARRSALYRFDPLHIVRRKDFDGLFDTTPDLSGSDLDISRYIRSAAERDVQVFWRQISEDIKNTRKSLPLKDFVDVSRDETCPVPIWELKKHIANKRFAWRLDYQDKEWERISSANDIFPGMTVMLDASEGGYDGRLGWKSSLKDPVSEMAGVTDGKQSCQRSPTTRWQTISEHCQRVGNDASVLAAALGGPENVSSLLKLAGKFHDWGKAHEAFQSKISSEVKDANGYGCRQDLAKAPENAWKDTNDEDKKKQRKGFRHEVASAFAILELLRRSCPDHEALTKEYREFMAEVMKTPAEIPQQEDNVATAGLIHELASLTADEFNLVNYLICGHHGKVRISIAANEHDQELPDGKKIQLEGIREGDVLPSIEIEGTTLPQVSLNLDAASLGLSTKYGPSWTERALDVLDRIGPSGLAYLEALLRASDMRVSKIDA